MAVIRGLFSDFYLATMLPAINRLIGERYRQYPTIYTRIFSVESSGRSIEQFSGVYLPDGFKDVMPYLVLIAVLVFFPRGLIGEAHGRRV